MNGDGTVFATAAPRYSDPNESENNNKGNVRIYELKSDGWSQMGGDYWYW